MKQSFFKRKPVMMASFFLAAFFIFTGFVMLLWNLVLPEVTGVKSINYLQAMCILLLSKILFGGFRGRGGMRGNWKEKMRHKMGEMTPEEREKFRAEWKNRCGNMSWGKRNEPTINEAPGL
ncbi:MAG: uncharacterized protein JWQ27_1351 [Ferruginibacter sp.]|nr:uncharacterized protein [Ferruginibacter sp.]